MLVASIRRRNVRVLLGVSGSITIRRTIPLPPVTSSGHQAGAPAFDKGLARPAWGRTITSTWIDTDRKVSG